MSAAARGLAHALAGAALLAVAAAAARDPGPAIEVQALFKDRAVVVIDGRRRMMSVGETGPEGVTLIAASSRGAVVEVAGERRELALGERIVTEYAPPREQRVRVIADAAGMYFASGRINGVPVRFVLDTGSTLISISEPLARRLGLDYRGRGTPGETVTAAGVVNSWRLRLARVAVGDIVLTEVDAAVLEGDFPETPLLGNSFLSRVRMIRSAQSVELVRTF